MTDQKSHIAFLLPVYAGGGAERVTETVALALEATGHYKVTILVWRADPGLVDTARSKGLDIVRLPCPESATDLELYRTPQLTDHVGHLLADGGYTALIMAMVPLEHIDRLRSIAPNCKLIFHHHGVPLYEVKEKLVMKAAKSSPILAAWRAMRERIIHKYRRQFAARYKAIYHDMDSVVVLCDAYRRQMEHIVGADHATSRIVALYNPLSTQQPATDSAVGYGHARTRCLKTAHSDKTVLFVGRLSYTDKRVDRLLRIWAMVAPQHPGWTLKIVGDGPERANLEALAQQLGITGSIQFCGYSANTAPYYSEASILCLTSEFEGWGMVLAEAQANGVWPIAFNVSAGVEELIGTDATRGTLVKPYSEKAYASALSALMADPARLDAMRPAMIASTRRYTPTAIANAWHRYLTSL